MLDPIIARSGHEANGVMPERIEFARIERMKGKDSTGGDLQHIFRGEPAEQKFGVAVKMGVFKRLDELTHDVIDVTVLDRLAIASDGTVLAAPCIGVRKSKVVPEFMDEKGGGNGRTAEAPLPADLGTSTPRLLGMRNDQAVVVIVKRIPLREREAGQGKLPFLT